METPPPNSELRLQLTATTAAAAAAWHVFGLLLSHRSPARMVELASKCYYTPDCIKFLCSIPDSPLLLTANQFVTVSSIGFAAIAQYIANVDVVSIYLDLPEFVPRSLKNARSNDIVKTYCRKRKRMRLEIGDFSVMKNGSSKEVENLNRNVFAMPVRFQNACFLDGNMIRSIKTPSRISSILNLDCQKLEKIMSKPSLFTNSSSGQLGHETENAEHGYNEMDDNFLNWEDFGYLHRTSSQSDSVFHGRIPLLLEPMVGHKVNSMPCPELLLPSCTMGNLKVSEVRDIDILNPVNGPDVFSSSQLEVDKRISVSQAERETVTKACLSLIEIVNTKRKELSFREFDRCRGYKKNVPINLTNIDESHMYKPGGENVAEAKNVATCLDKSRTKVHLQCQEDMQKQLVKSSFKPKTDQKNASSYREKPTCQPMENCQHVGPHREPEHIKREKKTISAKQRLKCNFDQRMNAKEKMAPANSNSHAEQIPFPNFESFIIEEAEGSGGYGTVYKAKRKADGVTFAIKCPHANANINHVHNELKMLERFGGKNFVIKYEGSLKNGNSDCLVLEHVEHDRPEVLKKEIDVFQLQWYGYCMFRALAGLHKQGIVHRDVKPGNFLFSRKVNKGYLIDFNLALDLHKKYGTTANSKAGHDVNFDHIPFSQTKSLPPVRNRKFQNTRFPEAVNQNAGKGFKSLLPPRNLKRKIDQAKVFTDTGSRNSIKSQGADGSGITSAKDATSTRTPSAERLREPLPSQGRKELISLVQEALQGGNNESVNAPTSKRKRVAAPPAFVDSKFFYPTPMPLHASGVAICGSGSLKNKGDGKHKREGPCVGTKGFRAPEVLFRSPHQGPKIDIWSAGVTLLYLIIGRAPFIGDPDQNIKEIAKLKGSEDLWEVAKLHNHESSFPMDLLDVKYLSPVELRDWCVRNTRRPYFLDNISNSLLDLVDKCLTVNPRLRISAEEALRHEFFAPCHEALKKHRLRRQGLNIDSGNTVLMQEQSQTREAVS